MAKSSDEKDVHDKLFQNLKGKLPKSSSAVKENHESDEPPQPKVGQCSFYIMRKKRFCRFPPHKDHRYCAEHAVAAGVDLGRKRIQCPLNPKHTCFEDCLKKHLKKCVKITKNYNIYYEEGINAGATDGDDIPIDKFTVLKASRQELLEFISRVNLLHAEYVSDIPLEELSHHSLKEDMLAPHHSFKVLRQRKQQASLIGHLEQTGFLQDGVCYVELGAGRGQLAHLVQLAMETCDDSSFILVDKGTCRYKFDSFHRGDHQGPTFERLQVNLADINLGKVPSISEKKRPVVGMGKHLCGDGTDLALRCLTQTLTLVPGGGEDSKISVPLLGVAIAVCCHHRCSWKGYVGKKFLKEKCGMSVVDFQLLSSMTSWATCSWEGWKKHVPTSESVAKSSVKQPEIADSTEESGIVKFDDCVSAEHEEDQDTDVPCERLELGLTPEEREAVGRKCKQLIDMGRVLYLQDNKMSASLKAYIHQSYTPENIVLLAKPITG